MFSEIYKNDVLEFSDRSNQYAISEKSFEAEEEKAPISLELFTKCIQIQFGEVNKTLWHPWKHKITSTGKFDCRLWKVDENPLDFKMIRSLPHLKDKENEESKISTIFWDTNSNKIATGDSDGIIRIWDENGMKFYDLDKVFCKM